MLTFSRWTSVVHIEHGHFIEVANSFDVIILEGKCASCIAVIRLGIDVCLLHSNSSIGKRN